ncbi:hypothetical protein F5Y08DRAFT_299078 [Xylaria arbuscula]|nr:hypothetical protein F5Y08DRAFT_299078 [Xylaria arbuscula]
MAPQSWELDFGRPKPAPTYLLENKAYFRELYETTGRRGSFVRMAMRDSRESQRYFCRADRIESFCGNLSIETLLGASRGLAVQPIALLDDRKADFDDVSKGAGVCRTQLGPLSPKSLHAELKKPRYNTTTGTVIPNTSTAVDASVAATEPDAERRLIYITDLNRCAILVLLDTASFRQAYYLRDFMYNHLVFAPGIGVTIPSTPFKNFAFVFHLPYYAWRKGPLYFQDERRMNGRPLRRSQRLGFLDETPWGPREGESEDCIYEAQISFLVAGLDDSSYIAYAFVDTYHNGPDSDESVKDYHEKSNTQGHYAMDPLSGGTLDADRPVWSPRLYFLRVLELRIEQVKEEFANSVFMIQKKTLPYIQDYQVPKDVYSSPDIEGRGERLRRFHDWTGSTVRLVMDLIHMLSKILHACDRFLNQDCVYFQDDNAFHNKTLSSSLCLASIAKHVEEMKDQLHTLQHLEKMCNNISRELEAGLALEDRNVTMIQARTNESVMAFAYLAFVVSPPAVTSALYSMNKEVLPWENNTRSWAITLGFFYLVLGVILWFLLKRSDKKRNQALRGQIHTSLIPPRAKAHRRSWIKRLWSRRRASIPRLSFNSPVSFRASSRFVDNEETELSDLGAQPQPTDFL